MPGEDELTDAPPVQVVVIGLLVGLVLGSVVAWRLSGDAPAAEPAHAPPALSGSPPPVSVPETAEAAEAFIAAWERSRRETYIAVSEWHRRTAQGAEATEVRVLAQRPPDRIRSGADHRSGRIGGSLYSCDRLLLTDEQLDGSEGLGPEVECRLTDLAAGSADPGIEAPATVAEEVALMRRHVEGRRPLYRVGQVGDCFHLRLDRSMVVPPYGHRTTFCFDPRSGAVSSLTVSRAEGTDTEQLLWVATEVTDDDLVAVIEGTFDPSARR